MKKLTTEEFIVNAIKVHGNKYDYSITKYTNRKSKVDILCPYHGVFSPVAGNHLNGSICMKCARRSTKEEFITKAKIVHNDFYDYSKTVYSTSSNKVVIVCPIHGNFIQTASEHLVGKGCAKCGILKQTATQTLSTTSFTFKAVQIHGTRYDYSAVVYTGCRDFITIKCRIHGEFLQNPFQHLQGQGCQECANRTRGGKSSPKPTILYCVYFPFYNLWKVGITAEHIGVLKRFTNDKKCFTVLKEKIYTSGKQAVKAERLILEEFVDSSYYGDAILLNGNTELLTISPMTSKHWL